MPVLVVYNVPGRDCSQYSSGGAGSDAAYTAWIDGVVKGLGSAKAVVVVEPDGLANLPSDCPAAYPGQDVAALTAGRIADVKYAGTTIEAKDPNSSVYLDAGNSAWHSAGDAASRLYQAGVGDVQGFSLNVSNYQFTVNSDFYGTWVSECLAYATPLNSTGVAVNAGDFADCGDEYYNGGPATNWAGGAMNRYAPWSAGNPDLTLNTDGVTSRYALELGSVTPTAHFVVDTGRNGTGPNDMSAYAAAPYNQPPAVITALQNGNWCNSPGARLGAKPTANTGVPLADAYLWVKTRGRVRRPVQHRRWCTSLGLLGLQPLGLGRDRAAAERPAVGHPGPGCRRLVRGGGAAARRALGPRARHSRARMGLAKAAHLSAELIPLTWTTALPFLA